MEPRFGYDFSRVRIHTDAAAASASRNLSASAFTLGSSIFFNADRYEPHRPAGLSLIAHELTHVVQQSGDPSRPTIQRSMIDYGQITWEDFKASPPAGHNTQEGAGIRTPFANSSYTPEGGESHDLGTKCGPRTKQLTNFKAMYHANVEDLDKKPAAQMDQDQSWAEARFHGDGSAYCGNATHGDKTQFATCMHNEVTERARLLKHEQGHFDIANVLAENARADIKGLAQEVTGSGCGLSAAQDAASAQYQTIREKLIARSAKWQTLKDSVENTYDTETGHGGDAGKQKAWETDIAKGLPKFKPEPDPPATTPDTSTAPPATAPDVKSTTPPQKK